MGGGMGQGRRSRTASAKPGGLSPHIEYIARCLSYLDYDENKTMAWMEQEDGKCWFSRRLPARVGGGGGGDGDGTEQLTTEVAAGGGGGKGGGGGGGGPPSPSTSESFFEYLLPTKQERLALPGITPWMEDNWLNFLEARSVKGKRERGNTQFIMQFYVLELVYCSHL
jgi:hypothetical protein